MMTLQEAVEFAQASAEAAFDCWRSDYATLQDAIDSHSDNVRDTLNDEHAAHFEYEAFKAFETRVALLHEHASEDARIAQSNEKIDCPQCDGEGSHGEDDEGFMYLCYACHGTGKMTTLEAQDYENESNS